VSTATYKYVPRPSWEGAKAFDRVWDAIEDWQTIIPKIQKILATPIEGTDEARRHVEAGHRMARRYLERSSVTRALVTRDRLLSSHVLIVDSAQANVIPDWDRHNPDEARTYLEYIQLPFDPLFIDFGSDGLRFSLGETAVIDFQIYGAQVWTEHDELYMEIFGNFVWKGDRDPIRVGAEKNGVLTPGQQYTCFGTPPTTGEKKLEGGYVYYGNFAEHFSPPWPGYGAWWRDDSSVGTSIGTLATTCFGMMAYRVLAVLFWLESANILVEELAITPQREKKLAKMERRGKSRPAIPHVVRVKPPKTRRKSTPTGDTRNYAYRFEVAGHYMHFPQDTQMGRAAGDKLVYDEAHGWHRRIWCPPHVKGPENKPLVVKTRMVGNTDRLAEAADRVRARNEQVSDSPAIS
jgi:hypothetical protein